MASTIAKDRRRKALKPEYLTVTFQGGTLQQFSVRSVFCLTLQPYYFALLGQKTERTLQVFLTISNSTVTAMSARDMGATTTAEYSVFEPHVRCIFVTDVSCNEDQYTIVC